MKILLVIPPRIRSRHRDFALSYSNPHIGMASLAAVLREKEHEVKVIDAQAEDLSFAELARRAATYSPGLVGITAYTEQIEEAGAAAASIKSAVPGTAIVIGGCHATALPRETLNEFPGFDLVVQGEGEIPLASLAQAGSEGRPWSEIAGIAGREDGCLRVNPPGFPWPDLDSLPFPAFDLFPLPRYQSFHHLSRKGICLSLSTLRGCPYSCIFCYKLMGSTVRSQSPPRVIEQLHYFTDRFHPGQIVFLDENFTIDRARARAICRGIRDSGLPGKVNFVCETRVDLVDRELLRELGETGFSVVSYGIESGVQKTLDRINKNIRLEEASLAVEWTREAGIKSQTNFIIGYPYETRDQARATVDFALKIDPDFCVFTILTPYPGTRVREMAEKGEGGARLLSRKWSHYGKHMGLAYETSTLPRPYLERLQTWAYLRFYFRIGKIRNLLRHIQVKVLPYYFFHLLESNLRLPNRGKRE